jgi:phage terminase large subunit
MDNNLYINDVYLKYVLKTDARVIVLYGGADSGKSYFTGEQYIPLSMIQEKYLRALLVRKYATTIRNSVFQEVVDGINNFAIAPEFDVKGSNFEIVYRPNGNKIICAGLDKVSKLKSIKGINLIWIEEAEEINQTEYENLLLRLRGGGYERLIMSFNPVDDEHFTNDLFQKAERKILEIDEWGNPKVWEITVKQEIDGELIQYKILVVKTTYKDNKFISPLRKLAIEQLKNTNPELWEILARGNYVSLGERIFNNWEVVEHTEEELKSYCNIRYGVDWGYFPDPFRFVKINVNFKKKIIDVVEEINLLEATNDIAIERIRPSLHDGYLPIKADSEEPKSIRDFKNAGIRMTGAKKGAGSVEYGIKKMQGYHIRIDKNCTHTISDFKLYKRKLDKDGNVTAEPIDAFNHSIDPIRYILEDYSEVPTAINIMNM